MELLKVPFAKQEALVSHANAALTPKARLRVGHAAGAGTDVGQFTCPAGTAEPATSTLSLTAWNTTSRRQPSSCC